MFRGIKLRQREVIDITSAEKLGFINDIEINESSGNIEAITVPKKFRFFAHIFGGGELIIPWENIEAFGREIVLVRLPPEFPVPAKKDER